ncbi:low molecular weight phosphotyrosine protein phosphatase [Seongchinamella sediminis]|uniref:protein-tyrosine-phosphatase n=2 Tax=Seongchinamella sediminis TaxID=2283635 RepID=A0A3L7DTM8_9GAMM|nr:low molecular weight phosphotyrosine protein phosphatase [Seongchinamella sediminis]
MAEGLFRHYARLNSVNNRINVRSAGIRASQPGAKPDQRAQRIAAANGVRLNKIRARQVSEDDLARYDLIVVMDRSHLGALAELCPLDLGSKTSLLLSHDPEQVLEEVPDPYYSSYDGFAEVYGMIDSAVVCLLDQVVKQGL